jgi:hypothetical protein
MRMQTYQNDPQFKAAFLAEITAHEQADALVKGDYGTMNGAFHGCAIGCAVYSLRQLQGVGNAKMVNYADHDKVAKDLGLPLWLAYMEDRLFENLPTDLSKTWPRRLAEAIPVGAVIGDDVLAKILVWSLTSDTFGVIHATDDAEAKGWITTIAEAITADAAGTITADQREAAARAARAAWDARAARAAWDARAAWAARAAWDARAARAAWAARAARAAWAAWAAWDARDAWDAWDARAAETGDAFYPALSEYVLSLLRDLPAKAA